MKPYHMLIGLPNCGLVELCMGAVLCYAPMLFIMLLIFMLHMNHIMQAYKAALWLKSDIPSVSR